MLRYWLKQLLKGLAALVVVFLWAVALFILYVSLQPYD